VGLVRRLESWARGLKVEVYALYLAYRDPRVSWYARVFAAVIVGYAFSPIDLIPDVIPVLGYLDDLIVVPLGVALAIKMIPPHVLAECRGKARDAKDRPANRVGAVVIVIVWITLAVLAVRIVARLFR
jgi:uncharacterized membrane protein YkvA (DUF1232 family)